MSRNVLSIRLSVGLRVLMDLCHVISHTSELSTVDDVTTARLLITESCSPGFNIPTVCQETWVWGRGREGARGGGGGGVWVDKKVVDFQTLPILINDFHHP